MTALDAVDPRLAPGVMAEVERLRHVRIDGIPRGATVALVGHRSAGKSALLPYVAERLGRPAVDLDDVLSRQRPLREWVRDDLPSFRAAERAAFLALSPGTVVAVGGGFLSSHPEALRGTVAVLVPISFETYAERLTRDTTRPRLRPELSVEEELRQVYAEREAKHAQVQTMPLARFLAAMERGLRARRVVTLPPNVEATSFAQRAKASGADLLEVRTDLTPVTEALHGAAEVLPLLVAERGREVPKAWLKAATLIDREATTTCDVRSFHAPTPLTVAAAENHWREVPASVQVKHVEPLAEPGHLATLLETQTALIERHGPERVTVLATGPLATAARAVLAQRNALDYLRFDEAWAAAPGQRFLADAVREARSPTRAARRLAILGSAVQHSRSPRLHRQPFDRLELPADVDLDALLEALRPHYRGFAVTNPFKKQAARSVGAALPAVNTLLALPSGWAAENTDVAGAAAVLKALGALKVTVLGDGGATEALRMAATERGTTLTVLTRSAITSMPIGGACVWTWPANVEIPDALRFSEAQVAVIAYGPSGRRIAQQIRGRGGTPRALGPRWLIAQARRQRALWESVR